MLLVLRYEGTVATQAGLTRTLVLEANYTPSMCARKAATSGLLAAGVFAAAEWIDPKDTEKALDAAAPD